MSQDKKIQDFQAVEVKLREDLSETFPAGSFDLFVDWLTKKTQLLNLNTSNIEGDPRDLEQDKFKYFKRDDKGNVLIGDSAFKSLSAGVGNVAVGDYAGRGVKKGTMSVFLGYNAGGYIENSTVSREDIRQVSPIIDKYWGFNAGANFLKQYFLDIDYTQHLPGSYGDIFLGAYSGLGDSVNRSLFSIHIGTRMDTSYSSAYTRRDYNNIIIGHELYTNHANSQIFNSVIIGNFLRTWKPNTTDNVLAIHNCKTNRVNVTDTLIYGEFEKRRLRINGKLELDLNRSNAEGDNAFTHEVVAKPDGTLGLRPYINNYIERVDVSYNVEMREEERFVSDESDEGYSEGDRLIRTKYRLHLDYKIIVDKKLFRKQDFSIEKISFLHDKDTPVITKDNFTTTIQEFDDLNEDSNVWVFVRLTIENGDLISYNSVGLRLMKTEFKFGTKSVFDIANFNNSWSARTTLYKD